MMKIFTSLAFILSVNLCEAYVGNHASKSAFLGQPTIAMKSYHSISMDMEKDPVSVEAQYTLSRLLQENTSPAMSVEETEESLGMPWKSSIDPKYPDADLLYMPFWEWHMSFMKENLTNLRVQPCSNEKTDFSYNENAQKKARIVSMSLSSSEYRKIRLTYYDAGETTQVYNAVFYPDPKYNLPVLGIDLLAFNRKKFLAIVDFQPIHEEESDHALAFEERLQPIKEKYESLKGRMSSKFYDETKFFSQQMLFSRFEDEKIISNELFPAFQLYVKTHLDMIREVRPNNEEVPIVLERQKAYDVYSAERDPATGLFTAMFGVDWAMDFVHDFLFSMSEKPDSPPQPHSFGGPPQSQKSAGKPKGSPDTARAERR